MFDYIPSLSAKSFTEMWSSFAFGYFQTRRVMAFYVYIIQSVVDGSYYKGFTEDPLSRLRQHNNADSKYTSRKLPWKLVYVEVFTAKKEALIREKSLKKYSHIQILSLISAPNNICAQFTVV